MSGIGSSLMPFASTIGFGGIVGFLIGFALKRIMKILAVIAGVFFAALLYLESQHIVNVNWDKLQTISNSNSSYNNNKRNNYQQWRRGEANSSHFRQKFYCSVYLTNNVNDGKPWYSANWQYHNGLYNWPF